MFFPFSYPVCFHSHYTSTAASRYFPYYQGIWICTRSVPVSIQPFAKLFYATCYLFIRYNMIKTSSVYKQQIISCLLVKTAGCSSWCNGFFKIISQFSWNTDKNKERIKEYIKKLEGHHTQERVSRVFIHI